MQKIILLCIFLCFAKKGDVVPLNHNWLCINGTVDTRYSSYTKYCAIENVGGKYMIYELNEFDPIIIVPTEDVKKEKAKINEYLVGSIDTLIELKRDIIEIQGNERFVIIYNGRNKK